MKAAVDRLCGRIGGIKTMRCESISMVFSMTGEGAMPQMVA